MFFGSWLPWEKAVFVLGCCVYLLLIAGVVKLLYDRRKFRTRAKDALARAELASERSIMRTPLRTPTIPLPVAKYPEMKGDCGDVSFSLMSIDSGIEVNGVWISRGNSPAQSLDRRSTSNLPYEDMPYNSVTDLDPGRMGSFTSHAFANRTQNRSTERFVSDTDTSIGVSSADCPLQYPAHTYGRYDNGSQYRIPRTMMSMEDISRSSSAYDSNRSDHSSSTGTIQGVCSTSSDDVGVRPHDMLVARSRDVHRETPDMLHSHRVSHAAEMGSLMPRVRRAGHSGEWASIANFGRIVPGEVYDYGRIVDMHEMTAPAGSSSSVKSNPFTVSSREESSYAETRSARTGSSIGPYEMLSKEREDAGQEASFTVSRPESQWRQVNSGFSVLKPGSMNHELTMMKDANDVCPQRQRSPVSRSRMSFTRGTSKCSHVSLSPLPTWPPASQVSRASPSAQGPSLSPAELQSEGTASSDHEGNDESIQETRLRLASVGSEETDASTDSGYEVAPTIRSELELLRRPSPLEIARGAEFERNSMVKFSFEAGRRPPNATEVAKGAALEGKGIVKYTFEEGQRPVSANEMRYGSEVEAKMKYRV